MGKESVIFYTIGCPRCAVLEKKLKEANIDYEIFSDVDKMLEMGMDDMPVLEVGGEKMNFSKSIKWIKEKK